MRCRMKEQKFDYDLKSCGGQEVASRSGCVEEWSGEKMTSLYQRAELS